MNLSGPLVVTGATGFVGRRLMERLGPGARPLSLASDDWRDRLASADLAGACVFHLGARVHRTREQDDAAFMADNVGKTRELAEAAARQGARRFVFLSTIKVLGEETSRPLRSDDPYAPQDAYARSKRAAEESLASIAMEVAIVRPPLVYGHGASGNLAALLRLCDSPWPLPLGGLGNRRSLVHVDDLADLLVQCAVQPQAAGRTYHAAHPRPVGTTHLVTQLRAALGRKARLVAVPSVLLEGCAALLGRREAARRLTRSLEVDSAAADRELGWVARVSPEEAIADLARSSRP